MTKLLHQWHLKYLAQAISFSSMPFGSSSKSHIAGLLHPSVSVDTWLLLQAFTYILFKINVIVLMIFKKKQNNPVN